MALVGAQFVNAVSPNPVGSLQAFAGADAPYGWLLCDGAETLISTYPELYSVLGTTYGALTNGSGGSGSTHFRVPDLRGRLPVGKDNMGGTTAGRMTTGQTGSPTWTGSPTTLGSTAGSDKHQLTEAQMPVHTHAQNAFGVRQDVNASASNGFVLTQAAFDAQGGGRGNANTGGNAAHPNVQPVIVTNYIIKAVSDAPRSGLAYGSTPPIVTALPANPQFGDVVTYLADATNGVAWNLQYDASGTYPWKFIGGPPLFTLASDTSTSSTTLVAMTNGSISAPLNGQYLSQYGGRIYNNTATSTVLAYCYGSTEQNNVDHYMTNLTAGNLMRMVRGAAVTAGTSLNLRIRVGGGTGTYNSCWLSILPERVSA